MTDLVAKRRLLLKISNAAISAQKGSVGPRMSIAIVAGVVTAMITGVTMQLGGNASGFPWVVMGSGLAVVALVNYFSPVAKTWGESLDNLLTEYEPVDHEAYAVLHRVTRERGGLEFSPVFEWIDREQQAISVVARPIPNDAGSKFINKSVAPTGDHRRDDR